MTADVAMEAVVAVAIGVLATIFLASMVALIVVCSHKYCCRGSRVAKQQPDSRPDVHLVEHMEGEVSEAHTDMELDDVGMNSNLEQILEDDAWVCDATGLAPHCIEILKTCHILTEKLVGMTMGNQQQLRSPETLTDIVAIAKRISPRVDDVVRSMYPPLDPRLLEARCTALVLSVSHLVLVSKSVCRFSGVLDWIDQSLADVDDHLKVLREASIAYEACYPLPNSLPTEGHMQISQQPQPMGSQPDLTASNENQAPPPVQLSSSQV